jgi:hypothetical protein
MQNLIQRLNLINLLLVVSLSVLLCSHVWLIKSFSHLRNANPLHNLRAHAVEPIFEGDKAIKFTGTFDRHIKCTLLNFDLNLVNDKSNDSLLLGPQHLIQSPPPATGPGENIAISFTLKMPEMMTTGLWNTKFTGYYQCSHGIFNDYKVVVVEVEPFLIQPLKP